MSKVISPDSFTPTGNGLVVKEIKPKDGIIVLPDAMSKPMKRGIVVRVGPGSRYKRGVAPCECQPGDVVHYPALASFDVSEWCGPDHYLVPDSHVELAGGEPEGEQLFIRRRKSVA